MCLKVFFFPNFIKCKMPWFPYSLGHHDCTLPKRKRICSRSLNSIQKGYEGLKRFPTSVSHIHTHKHTQLIFPSSFFSIKYSSIRFTCSFQQLFPCSHHEGQQDLIMQHLCHAHSAQLRMLRGQTLHLCFHWYLFPFLKAGAILRLQSEK